LSIVVDASVLVAALIETSPDGAWSEHVLDGQALYAPEMVLVETTNILRRFEQAKKISTAEANAAQYDLMQLELELLPFGPFADRIWELRRSVTSYDAWYVAVAEAMGFPLATLDGRLAKTAGPSCKFLVPG
jgi:predicted nucleic acid-binding protein